jgi:hypothetical protein
MTLSLARAAIAFCAFVPVQLSAHPHSIESNDQVIANGQNHPAFVLIDGEFISCDEFTHLPGYGPAWYGIETAHHGPDAATPGKGDGCYMIENGLSPLNPDADRNPAIK